MLSRAYFLLHVTSNDLIKLCDSVVDELHFDGDDLHAREAVQTGGVLLRGEDGATCRFFSDVLNVLFREVMVVGETHHLKIWDELSEVVLHLFGGCDSCDEQWVLA